MILPASATQLLGRWSSCEVKDGVLQSYTTLFNKEGERVEIVILGEGRKCRELEKVAKIALVIRWLYEVEAGNIHQTLISEEVIFFDKKAAKKNRVENYCPFKEWIYGKRQDCALDISKRNDFQDLSEAQFQKSINFKISQKHKLQISDSPFDFLLKH